MSTAVVVLSDPQNGEESLGRLFNALAATYDLQQRGLPVDLIFQGAGTRWISVVTQPDHPAHGLYRAVEGRVAGVSGACAGVFGTRGAAESAGFALLTNNRVPGTSGMASLAGYIASGDRVLTF